VRLNIGEIRSSWMGAKSCNKFATFGQQQMVSLHVMLECETHGLVNLHRSWIRGYSSGERARSVDSDQEIINCTFHI